MLTGFGARGITVGVRVTVIGVRGIACFSPASELIVEELAEGLSIGLKGVPGLVIADADITDVWGWLSPLLKGLNNQDGANFDLLPREAVFVEVVVDAERLDCTEWIED